ncbi:hypothetical protein EYF80_063216 [Liparis tanakae]|uniref:Uncharacterized protein n=1 Tax=Liparis tanakae TaxID=230148 RepID=A0A4Z2ECZ8_9TELE|nr:hypothetical protein EYF80_063216 [Liparis tanakae]
MTEKMRAMEIKLKESETRLTECKTQILELRNKGEVKLQKMISALLSPPIAALNATLGILAGAEGEKIQISLDVPAMRDEITEHLGFQGLFGFGETFGL